jgi:hypothetical protein
MIFIIFTSLPNNTRSGVRILVIQIFAQSKTVDELGNLADLEQIWQIW